MEAPSRPSLLERLSALLMREPEDRAQLMALLRSAHQRSLLDADALSIIEGALAVSDMQVRDVMVPRAQMQVISLADAPAAMASQAIETGHSRFPVTGENRDDVIGILLAKDLLRLQAGEQVAVRDLLRPAVFIPDSKRLNVLLREFRASRNHMAIVVDEYGGVAGLVTIEDVLEQIVGDIEDEYDFDEAADSILLDQAGHYRVKATTGIETFDAAFGTRFAGEDYNTVGGMVIHHLGRLPRRGEIVQVGGLRIQVLRADSRRVHTLLVDLPRATT
ncbi:MAG: Magnesium and cobalt efflux protein CorC [Rhodocyclaceae bacterium]|nr:MAG: CBS domain-containing protein [Rhodocyclaceae bacterium]MBV6406987.1 Magnesium and cobalt efflux protein CorC [Rhodocyclaceae bacterium]CAG0944576.1 Magnesium and cobalt efflux protein CorC [Gammaproteobacteria bacterium]